VEIKISFAIGEEEKLGPKNFNGLTLVNSKTPLILTGMLMELLQDNTKKLTILFSLESTMQDIWFQWINLKPPYIC